ncbi:MAG: YhfC family glutamic-type intramembrane protease [Bacillota bacterium]|nr:YhfC family glutamic-type intramembrane protease [Bacillota bacterium]
MKSDFQCFKLFVLGCLSFFISQIVLRLPLLNYLNSNFSFTKFALAFPLFVNGLILVSAGLFEESFRFFFRKFFLRANNYKDQGLLSFTDKIKAPIVFGLGHGLCEVVYVLYLAGFGFGLENYLLIFVERFLAVVFHICQSILIFKGFRLGKEYLYLFIGIFLHTAFNGLIYLGSALGLMGLYGLFLIFDLVYVLLLKNLTYERKVI